MNYSKLTVKQLRALASDRNINLKGLTLKAQIIDAIVDAETPAPAPAPALQIIDAIVDAETPAPAPAPAPALQIVVGKYDLNFQSDFIHFYGNNARIVANVCELVLTSKNDTNEVYTAIATFGYDRIKQQLADAGIILQCPEFESTISSSPLLERSIFDGTTTYTDEMVTIAQTDLANLYFQANKLYGNTYPTTLVTLRYTRDRFIDFVTNEIKTYCSPGVKYRIAPQCGFISVTLDDGKNMYMGCACEIVLDDMSDEHIRAKVAAIAPVFYGELPVTSLPSPIVDTPALTVSLPPAVVVAVVLFIAFYAIAIKTPTLILGLVSWSALSIATIADNIPILYHGKFFL